MTHWCDIGVNMPDNRLPVESVLAAAVAADVTKMLLTGTSIDGSHQASQLASRYPQYFYATTGIHPHYAKDVQVDYIEQLKKLASQPKVIAIGECGLDFNRNISPKQDQLTVFEQQLELAAELQLPVFLHERDAFSEQLSLLDKYVDKLVGGVAHCFTGDSKQMEAYLERGLYIGITGWVCDEKRGSQLREALTALPLNRLLLETDAPYLIPKTMKNAGRTNVPANLPHIAAFVAQTLSVDLATIKHASWNNTSRLFQLSLEEATNAV